MEDWDKGPSALKAKAPDTKETNAYLKQVKFTITTYYQQLQLDGKEITPQLLKVCFLGEDIEETCCLRTLGIRGEKKFIFIFMTPHEALQILEERVLYRYRLTLGLIPV